MIQAKFYKKNGKLTGFSISGHAEYADAGEDVVCAAVSSAVQFAVNLLDEFGCKPKAEAENNTVKCMTSLSFDISDKIFSRLKEHICSVSEEFPKTIKITISEV